MKTKISEDVSKEMQRIQGQGIDEEIAIIITLKQDADTDVFEGTGLQIQHHFDIISAVSGTATPDTISALATLHEVEIIELDGQMHTAQS